MARVVILPVPAYGHVHPTLPLAQELLARGEDVSYSLPDLLRETISETGAGFLPFQSTGRGFVWKPVSCEELFAWMPLHQAVLSWEVLPQLLKILRASQPDYLIYDAACLWGRLAANILRLPAIRFHTSFVMNEQLGPDFQAVLDQANQVAMPRAIGKSPGDDEETAHTFQGAADQLCATYNVPSISLRSFFGHAEPLNLVPIPADFQPGADSFDKRYQFLGPSIAPRPAPTTFPFEQLQPRPTLYISMGSVCNREVDFLKTCLTAFGETTTPTNKSGLQPGSSPEVGEQPWQVILASGAANMASLGPIPGNFVVRPSVPQIEVLERTTVFVTHGGMNSVMEALWYGVPMVVVPHMAEQAITARRVEELGIGLALEKSTVTAETLREAVRHVTADPQIRERVQRMQETVRQSGGAPAAADAVIHYTRTEGQKGWSWAPRRASARAGSPRQRGRHPVV